MKPQRTILWLLTLPLVVALLLKNVPVKAAEDPVRLKIKASYIYNFLQFVNFPEDSLPNNRKLYVCILGKDPFGRIIQGIVGSSTPQGTISIRRLGEYSDQVEFEDCNVLFLSGSEAENMETILKQVDVTNIVTIGDVESFISYGGLIEFYEKNDSLRFRINETLARTARFRVAAQLVQLGVQ